MDCSSRKELTVLAPKPWELNHDDDKGTAK